MTTYTPRTSAVRDQQHAALIYLSGLARVRARRGAPEGAVPGTRGDLVVDVTTGSLWIKTTGAPGGALTQTGWQQFSPGVSPQLEHGASISTQSFGSGALRTSVLLFAGISNTGSGVVGTSDPNNGTEVRISEPGVYSVSLGFDVTNGSAIYGISLGQTTDFTSIPAFSIGGVLSRAQATAPAGTRIPCFVGLDIIVDEARAAQAVPFRFVASDAAGLAPSAIVAGSGWYRVQRTANVSF